MATITKIGVKTWRVRYDDYSTGKRVQRSKTFERQSDAKIFVSEVEIGKANKKSGDITLGEWIDTWYSIKQKNIMPTTQSGYYGCIQRIKKSTMCNMKLNNIKPSHIQAFLSDMDSYACSTVKTTYRLLRQLMLDAMNDGLIDKCPSVQVNSGMYHVRHKMPTDLDSIVRQVESLRNRSGYVGLALAMYCGMRIGEVCGLMWSDIDFDNRTINIHQTRTPYRKETIGNNHTGVVNFGCVKFVVKDCTKNGGSRTITMPNIVYDALIEERKKQEIRAKKYMEYYIKSDYVCVGMKGLPVSESFLEQIIRPVCRFHDLRHVHISMLLNNGVPVTEISRRVGHSSPNVTLKVYSHTSNNLDKNTADAIDDIFSNV